MGSSASSSRHTGSPSENVHSAGLHMRGSQSEVIHVTPRPGTSASGAHESHPASDYASHNQHEKVNNEDPNRIMVWSGPDDDDEEVARAMGLMHLSKEKVVSGKFFEASFPAPVRPATSMENYAPEDVLDFLMEGNKRFVNGKSIHPHQDNSRLKGISQKQKPFATILSCSDSRVATELLFDQGFGDLFICRVAGNVATADEIASLEYSVVDLGVKVVVVLGHSRCGAVKAALSGDSFPGFIDALLDNISTAIERVNQYPKEPADRVHAVITENVRYQSQRVLRSHVISEAVEKGEVIVVGGYYDLDTFKVELLK